MGVIFPRLLVLISGIIVVLQISDHYHCQQSTEFQGAAFTTTPKCGSHWPIVTIKLSEEKSKVYLKCRAPFQVEFLSDSKQQDTKVIKQIEHNSQSFYNKKSKLYTTKSHIELDLDSPFNLITKCKRIDSEQENSNNQYEKDDENGIDKLEDCVSLRLVLNAEKEYEVGIKWTKKWIQIFLVAVFITVALCSFTDGFFMGWFCQCVNENLEL